MERTTCIALVSPNSQHQAPPSTPRGRRRQADRTGEAHPGSRPAWERIDGDIVRNRPDDRKAHTAVGELVCLPVGHTLPVESHPIVLDDDLEASVGGERQPDCHVPLTVCIGMPTPLPRPLGARLSDVSTRLPGRLAHEIGRSGDRFKGLALRADTALATRVSRERSALAAHERMLLSLSYKNVLKRGYAVIRDEGDAVLSSVQAVGEGQALSFEFADGRVSATAGDGAHATIRPKKIEKPAPVKKPEQGSRF